MARFRLRPGANLLIPTDRGALTAQAADVFAARRFVICGRAFLFLGVEPRAREAHLPTRPLGQAAVAFAHIGVLKFPIVGHGIGYGRFKPRMRGHKHLIRPAIHPAEQ